MRPIDHILIDLRTSDITLGEFMKAVENAQAMHPDWEIFLDGDACALVGREVTAW